MTPATTNQPGRKVQLAWSGGVQVPSNPDHVVALIAMRQARSKEYAPQVNVVRDVAPMQVSDLNSEVTFQDFHRHGRLLLTDSGEGVKAPLQLLGSRLVSPDSASLAAIFIDNTLPCQCEPAWNRLGIPMQGRRCLDSRSHRRFVTGDSGGVEVS